MIWTARLIYRAGELRPGELRSIRAALKQYASVEHDTTANRLHVTLDVDCDTISEAAAIAVETAATARALPAPMRLDVMSKEAFGVEAGQPAPLDLDLMRITDIAALLGVSRQRVDQLAAAEPRFALLQNRFRQFGMDTVRGSVRRAQQQGHALDLDAEHTALAITLLFERFTSVSLSQGLPDEAAITTLSTIWRKTLYGNSKEN